MSVDACPESGDPSVLELDNLVLQVGRAMTGQASREEVELLSCKDSSPSPLQGAVCEIRKVVIEQGWTDPSKHTILDTSTMQLHHRFVQDDSDPSRPSPTVKD